MDTISILLTRQTPIEEIERKLAQHWCVESSSDGGLVIHAFDSRAYLHPELKSGDTKDCKIMIDYSDVEVVKSILATIADDSGCLVDNDFGVVLPGNEFVERCRRELGWDWRNDARTESDDGSNDASARE